MKFPKDPKLMTLREYCDCRDDMGRERRHKRPLSYGVHSTDAFIARHRKYEKEYSLLIK